MFRFTDSQSCYGSLVRWQAQMTSPLCQTKDLVLYTITNVLCLMRVNCCKCTVFLHETDWVSAFLLKSLGMEFSLLNNWKLKMFLDSDYIHVYGKLFLGSLNIWNIDLNNLMNFCWYKLKDKIWTMTGAAELLHNRYIVLVCRYKLGAEVFFTFFKLYKWYQIAQRIHMQFFYPYYCFV